MRYCVLFLLLAALLSGSAFVLIPLHDRAYDSPNQGKNDLGLPQFLEVELPFIHHFEPTRGVPYASAAVIDVDNDGKDEIFLGGGVRQTDALLRLEKGKFIDIADSTGLVKQGGGVTTGVTVIDIDDNGYSDLLVARDSGLWLYLNDNGQLTLQDLKIAFLKNEIPLSPAISDLNRDGHSDFLLPSISRGSVNNWYSLKEEESSIRPRLFINNGDNSFADITSSVGLQMNVEALQAYFEDLDEDSLEDLIVLGRNGSIETWKNRGMLLFERKHHSLSNIKGDFMGMGVGDYDNDNRVDFLLTNRGTTIRDFMVELLSGSRPLRYGNPVLMKNMGFFSFHDHGQKLDLDNFQLSRGSLIRDIDGNGAEDLAIAQNHPYWPFHLVSGLRLPGKVLLQKENRFYHATSQNFSLGGDSYGVGVLQGDFNGDHRPDLLHVALGGSSRVLFLSETAGNNFLSVHLPDTSDSLGAEVTVKLLSGVNLTKKYRVGGNLCGDSTHVLYFGLGATKATDVFVQYKDGRTDQTSGVLLNTDIVFQ